LSDAIIIMTSNLGSQHFRKLTSPLGFGAGQADTAAIEGEVMRELERRFPPEFRNRIDEIVLFAPLTKPEVRQIAQLYLQEVAETLRGRGKSLQVDDEALDLIVEQGHSLAYGARFLKRVIDECVKLPISEHWATGQQFRVRVDGDRVVVDGSGPRLVSTAAEPPALAYGT
jgi:ATP-dependent Clp protease ATP-binding subunit ClpA